MTTILGIHMGHDGSLTILENGVPTFCVSEERFTRQKMYFGFPHQALQYAIEHRNFNPGEISLLAMDTNELPLLLGSSEISRRFDTGPSREVSRRLNQGKQILSYFFGVKNVDDQLKRENEARKTLISKLEEYGFLANKIKVFDHHLSHAASAYWPSPFEKALYVTCDGRGDDVSATLGWADGEKLIQKHTISDLDSIGQFYAAVTFFLGFRPNRHEGKITGLAAHGDPQRLGSEFLKNLTWQKDGSFKFRIPEKYRLSSSGDYTEFLRNLSLSLKDRIVMHTQEGLNTVLYSANWYSLLAYLQDVAKDVSREDVAAGVQYLAEQVCVGFVKNNLPAEPIPVVLAGGVFANVCVNQKIRELDGVTNVFIQPAMGDDGLSLGAALLGYAHIDTEAKKTLMQFPRNCQLKDVYLGPEYSDDNIKKSCQHAGVNFAQIPDIEQKIAEWIHQGLIVGYYRGRMEFGPRALGHRSILARPIEKEINDQINERLRRTEFMPFAPSILAEHSADYFQGYSPDHVASEYMTITYDINSSYIPRIPAVAHVDGTARPQVVHQDKEPTYHRIISEYYKKSGIPLIINTSFNMHEEPIVCTPQDAIRSYKANCVDILVMKDYVVGGEKLDL